MAREIVWEPAGVLIRCRGTLTDDDLLGGVRAFYADPRFGPSIRYQLFDALAVDALDLRTEAVREAALIDREMSKKFPVMAVAVVAAQTVIYGLARLYAMQLEPSPWATEIFTDLAAARAWIQTTLRDQARP